MGKLLKIMIKYFLKEEKGKKEDIIYLNLLDLLDMQKVSIIAKMKEKKLKKNED